MNSQPQLKLARIRDELNQIFVERAVERNLRSNGDTFDPQKKLIEEGAHVYGTVVFNTSMDRSGVERLRKQWRLTFQDAARRTLPVAG